MEEGTKEMSDQDQQIPMLIDQEAEHIKGTGTGTGTGTVTVTGESITNQNQYHSRGRTALYATLAGIAVGGPLLCMMGLSLIASVTLLLISSPLLFIFSPLLISAALVILAALAGFAAVATMGVAGVWTFRLMIRWRYTTIGSRSSSDGSGHRNPMEEKQTLTESGQRVEEEEEEEEQGKDTGGGGGYLQHNVDVSQPEENIRSIEVE